ncbi:MAG: aminopeptidase [Chromatiaceae bacterium]|nr:aminopeptidase [Chromatiaceae bacterium]
MRRAILLGCWLFALSGCSSVAYYAQSARGQAALLSAARPIDQVVGDPRTSAAVRERLSALPELRRFAVSELALPHSGSFRRYAALDREAAVWSLVAAPPDGLQPREWCYPVVGCASYRGYFSHDAALEHAERARRDGWDVAVDPVPAYSTLGWFDDPLPSTVIDWPLADIAGLVFHELAHEALYLAGDSAFNEAYASVVEHEGRRRWLQSRGDEAQRRQADERDRRRADFLQLLSDTRMQLTALYASSTTDRAALRTGKVRILGELQQRYRLQKVEWGGYAGYDWWFARPLNNAHFASISTYSDWQPALSAMLRQLGGRMDAFHTACRRLATLPAAVRARYLDRLAPGSRGVPHTASVAAAD